MPTLRAHTATPTAHAATCAGFLQVFRLIATVDMQQRATEGWKMMTEQSSVVAEALALMLEGWLMLYIYYRSNKVEKTRYKLSYDLTFQSDLQMLIVPERDREY